MDKKDVMKMFKEEVEAKVDSETLDKLKQARTKDEAFSILKGVSIELDDEMLAAVAGGDDEEDDSPWYKCDNYSCQYC